MKAAQEMGWQTLLVNAVKGNQDMLRIYKSLGFRFIERYPECSAPIELTDYFDYMEYDFQELHFGSFGLLTGHSLRWS